MGKVHTFNEYSSDIPWSEPVSCSYPERRTLHGAAQERKESCCFFIAVGAENACLRGGRVGQDIVLKRKGPSTANWADHWFLPAWSLTCSVPFS